jgi:hypothetical protein
MDAANAFGDLERPCIRSALEANVTLHTLITSTMSCTPKVGGDYGTTTSSATSSYEPSIDETSDRGAC